MPYYLFLFLALFTCNSLLDAEAYASTSQRRYDTSMSTHRSVEKDGSVFIGEDAKGDTILRATPPAPLPEPEQPAIPFIIPDIQIPYNPQRPPEPRQAQ